MKTLQMVMMSVVAGVVLAGCAKESVNTVEPADRAANPKVIRDLRIVTDSSLADAAQPLEVRETRTDAGFLKVQVEILNTTRSRERINYRFEWLDDEGMLIDSPLMRWSTVSLAGGEAVWLQAIAPSPKAVDFRLKLLEPEND